MLTPVELTKGGSDTDAANYSTASITPNAGRTVLAAFLVYDAGALANVTPTASGCGLTWTRIASVGGGGNITRLHVFRASTGSSTPSSEAVTITGVVSSGNADGAAWYVIEIPGTTIVDTDGVLQSDTVAVAEDDFTSGGLVLGSSFRDSLSGSVFFMGAVDNAGGTVNNTAGTGFTELGEVDQTAGGFTLTMSFMYAAGNVAQAVATTSSANDLLHGVMLEIGHGTRPSTATGTGTANNPSAAIAPSGGNAAGTGTANGASGSVAPSAGNAAGTGTANGATSSIAPGSGVATGSGTANGGQGSLSPTAVTGTGTGTANDATTSIAPGSGVATGSGAANGGSGSLSPTAATATATGTAFDATTTDETEPEPEPEEEEERQVGGTYWRQPAQYDHKARLQREDEELLMLI